MKLTQYTTVWNNKDEAESKQLRMIFFAFCDEQFLQKKIEISFFQEQKDSKLLSCILNGPISENEKLRYKPL